MTPEPDPRPSPDPDAAMESPSVWAHGLSEASDRKLNGLFNWHMVVNQSAKAMDNRSPIPDPRPSPDPAAAPEAGRFGAADGENLARLAEWLQGLSGISFQFENGDKAAAAIRAALAEIERLRVERDAVIRCVLIQVDDSKPRWRGVYGWLGCHFVTYEEAVAAVRKAAGLPPAGGPTDV